MGVQKQSVSFTEAAFAYARELVDQGEYPTISAAVSGELARARQARAREAALLEAEVRRRLELPLDQWAPVGDLDELTAGALARLDVLEREAESQDSY
jgi:Arc/MetJ-type ribon-helix-helix transcriptional regulator